MPDQEFKIQITTTADIEGFRKSMRAAEEWEKGLGSITLSEADVKKATEKTSEAIEEGAEKFSESKRETREAANELGKLFGVHDLGVAAMGRTGVAIFAMGLALEHLKSSYEEIQSTINGPLNIEIPADAPAHISAAATAWNQYAEARRKVIENATSPEAIESAAEKSLARELNLVHQVLAAEKEKALADLEMQRGQMSPEEYAATRANISGIFEGADQQAQERNRRELIAIKSQEAANLEADAKNKRDQAAAIKVAPKEVAEANQKILDANAADAEKARKELLERQALIERQKSAWEGGDVPEYEGIDGAIKRKIEENTFQQRYGSMGFDSAESIEKTRLDQAQAEIDRAANYRASQEQGKTKSELETQAGQESGRAQVLRGQVKDDSAFERRQNETDAYVASLHQSSARQMAGASAQTVEAVQRFTRTTVGGFADVHAKFTEMQQQLELLRRQISQIPFGNH